MLWIIFYLIVAFLLLRNFLRLYEMSRLVTLRSKRPPAVHIELSGPQ